MTDPALPGGVTASMTVGLTRRVHSAGAPPTVTIGVPVPKFVPVMVMNVPPGTTPEEGEIDVIVGTAA